MSDTPKPPRPSQKRGQEAVVESEGMVFKHVASAAAPSDQALPPRDSTPYDVGFGKPPKRTQFKKGVSGNPAGRQRQPKPRQPRITDGISEDVFEKEMLQSYTVRENGKETSITGVQALYKALKTSGLKGNRLAAQYLLEEYKATEKEQSKLMVDRAVHLYKLKREGEETLADCEKRKVKPPKLLPHPDDIVINMRTLESRVEGPENIEEAKHYDYYARLRDYLYIRSIQARGVCGLSWIENGENILDYGFFCAIQLNRGLPRSYRWHESMMLGINADYDQWPMRHWEKLIKVEEIWLRDNRPAYHPTLPPEFVNIVHKLLENGIGRAKIRTGIPADSSPPAASPL